MFNVDYETSRSLSLNEIRDFQLKNRVILPSDYVFLLLNYNEFRLANDHVGLIFSEDNLELTGLESPVFSLDDFYRVNCVPSKEAEDYYHGTTDKYFTIGTLLYNGALLIGKTVENLNKIYIDMPLDLDDVLLIADNFFELINDKIKVVH